MGYNNYPHSSNNYINLSPVFAGSPSSLIFLLAIIIVSAVPMWKVFTKAGQPGWAAIIPIYNIYVLMKIVGRPGWWLLLYLIPYVNLAIAIVIAVDLAKSFGRTAVFAIFGLILFPMVGYLMLAFGDNKYIGPSVLPKTSTSKK